MLAMDIGFDDENEQQANGTGPTHNDADRRRTAERLECIQSQAKRLCTAILDEMSHLSKEKDKAEAAGEVADKKANEAAAALEAEKVRMANQQQYSAQIVLEVGSSAACIILIGT